MNVALVSTNYPSIREPHRGIFVQRTATSVQNAGANVTVFSLDRLHSFIRPSLIRRRDLVGPDIVRVPYPSFSTIGIAHYRADRISRAYRRFAVGRALKSRLASIDVVLAHFLSSAESIADTCTRLDVPYVVSLGESDLPRSIESIGQSRAREVLREASMVITVAPHLSDLVVNDIGLPKEKVVCVPNAVDNSVFKPRDRFAARKRLELPRDAFIVAFVGSFNERKGAFRLTAALEAIPGAYGVFLGKGPLRPHGPSVLYRGLATESEVAGYLNAADVFVLPTQSEGWCNAINEAMASGLPIITSRAPSIREQVGDDAGIFVEWDDVEELSRAIALLKDDGDMREAMGAAAAQRSGQWTMPLRGEKLLNLLSNRAKNMSVN